MIECMRNVAKKPQDEENSQADVAFIVREQNDMDERDEDARKFAVSTVYDSDKVVE